MGLVCDLNSRMAQMLPLFNDTQQLGESKIMDLLANKVMRTHKAMMVSQDFNPGTGDRATFVEYCKQDETTDNIALSKFYASDSDIDTTKGKNVSRRLRNAKTAARNVIKTPRPKILTLL